MLHRSKDVAGYKVSGAPPAPLDRRIKTMAKDGNDFLNTIKKMITDVPANYKDALGNVVEYNSKLSEIALETAKKNAALSQAWANDTLGGIEALTKVPEQPSAYATVATDFVSAQAKSAPEHVAAFAEVVKQAQIETVELLLTAGKALQAEATEVAKKVTPTKA
jgi:hypothetical protein